MYTLCCRVTNVSMQNVECDLRREQYRTFKYLAGFVREWLRLGLDDEALCELETLILHNPDAGAVMAGTGGLRKLRFSPSRWRRGKSGSLRIGYTHDRKLEKVLVIAVYAKNDKANLTPNERRQIKRLLTLLWQEESK
jgi:hypothetical protein